MKTEKALYILSALLLGFGATLPLMTISKLVVVSNSFSLIGGVWSLFVEGQYAIFAIVFIFSVIFPIVKMYLLFVVVFQQSRPVPKIQHYLKLMHDYGRWAMLDVMVVAVIVVSVKLGALASVEVHIGLYLFGASVLIAMYLTQRVGKLLPSFNEH
ncbi:MAG: paraquat-inducible protein A [Pseudohongiellaceae bacterium]|nr:paraquat-inducible protein A [Pseudohongiellaceae bacterium]